ncbi:MAG: DUF4440 domain-containing protein [Candidatus Korobacteraceae bacterium]
MYLRSLSLLMLLVFTRPLFASADCSAYPAGDWKLDRPSALQFEQVWLQTLNQKNTAALNCMLDAEFRDTSRKGILRPKDVVLRELTQRKEQDQYQQKLTELEPYLFDDTAIIHGVNIISDQKGHEVLRIRFTDVLRFTDGHWLAVAAQETDEQPH